MCKGECGIGPFVIGVRPGKRRDGRWGCLMPDWDAKIGVCMMKSFWRDAVKTHPPSSQRQLYTYQQNVDQLHSKRPEVMYHPDGNDQ